MSKEQLKEVARSFIERLRSNSLNAEQFKMVIKQFALESPETQKGIAIGLVEIGEDAFERTFDRNFALVQLGLIARTCGLRGNKDLKERLSALIDNWISHPFVETGKHHDQTSIAPWGAIWALGAVDRGFGLEKCDTVIKHYAKSGAASQLHKLRSDLERLNPSESEQK